MVMNPYEADPAKVPVTDLYADVPLYGRYLPQPDDFVPDPQQIGSPGCWEAILAKCDASNRLYEGMNGGRDVFALGSVVVKASHLNHKPPQRGYSQIDANEVAAIDLVRDVLATEGISVPTLHFAGKVKDRATIVQSRIPGVTLNVAWPYLSNEQKISFKAQARKVLQLLHSVAPSAIKAPSYIVPDDEPIKSRNITELEFDLLFGNRVLTIGSYNGTATAKGQEFSLAHNDFTESNIIVNDDKIVGIIDWEMAGWFGWDRASAVHAHCRAPKRNDFAKLDLDEERLVDLTYWNDLYMADLLS